ncbi:uncharacterized protein LOC118646109 [Monomorium pharaonis]|uniref:uncharacterized protein LOC118646104 n=1 Tax=Monomorium pharaonis TaxID=307658 RepID=UPI001746BE46|nr:uncharacterized protein LOC118646104 [Monomorium pharaonis]XP_036144297.1 uncharacterized protein LOC118646109 [Monomorium pharaonis]
MDPNVEPWVYPIFYPYGTQGWHRNLMRIHTRNPRRVSRSAYVKYRMAIRVEFNPFIRGRRLFQQWVVDNYVKIEKDRIDYCKENQKQLRAESYQGLVDYLQNAASDRNGHVGKMIILPSSFVGSPRNMMQNYQDAMAIVRKYGKPDFFITMTCNPNWREIKENLLPGQQTADRPDLCARVFDIKKKYLVDIITGQNYFGKVSAYINVIEFQKRGLPHLHMLIHLKHNYKITTPEIVDRYISAEIPDPCENPVLHDIIIKNMIHGPCGDWCIVNEKCSKHYPKPLQNETTMNEDGYPHYRRRDTGVTFERPGGYIVDNSFVVPYSPKLSLIFNCHINVEVVSSIKSVKYLYKYVYKGHDAATVVISGTAAEDNCINHDEIRDYIDTRYVGPVEACWRILNKNLQEKSHTVIRLPVHLPNKQNFTINIDNDENEIAAIIDQTTMLQEYFILNGRDEEARQYTYTEIPSYFAFKKQKINGRNISRWEKRKAHFKCIGRMYSISPTQIELFHLRLLLLTVKGATSFQDLRTVNNVVHETYTAACLTLGLIEDDEQWKRAMHEAEIWMMPRQLRRLFIRILIHCQPIYPEQLWEEFKVSMSEDYLRNCSNTLQAQRKSYININTLLTAEGMSLSNFPSMEQLNEIDESLNDVSFEETLEIGMQKCRQLNDNQKNIVDIILNAVNNSKENETINNCFYVDGPGGTGKTFVYITLWYLLKGRKKRVSTMVFTGIAATLLPQGKTVHKTFGLPVPLFCDSSSNIKAQSNEAQILKETDVFIWDEAPMAPRYALEIMDRTLRDIMLTDRLFGGKIVVILCSNCSNCNT